jgi:hypothetical protein
VRLCWPQQTVGNPIETKKALCYRQTTHPKFLCIQADWLMIGYTWRCQTEGACHFAQDQNRRSLATSPIGRPLASAMLAVRLSALQPYCRQPSERLGRGFPKSRDSCWVIRNFPPGRTTKCPIAVSKMVRCECSSWLSCHSTSASHVLFPFSLLRLSCSPVVEERTVRDWTEDARSHQVWGDWNISVTSLTFL